MKKFLLLLVALLVACLYPGCAHQSKQPASEQSLTKAPIHVTVVASKAVVGETVSIKISAIDPQNMTVNFGFDWNNDGIVDEYSGYVESGKAATVRHIWTEPGAYSFSVCARNQLGQVSQVSEVNVLVAKKT